METSELASRLRMLSGMTWRRAAILAVLSLGACGIGADEANAQPPAQGAAATGTTTAGVSKPSEPQPELRPRTSGDPDTALPQDPVPDFEAKRGPRPVRTVTASELR